MNSCDFLVDTYLIIIEDIGSQIENLENSIIQEEKELEVKTIHHLKREIMFMKKRIRPLRDIVGNFSSGTLDVFKTKTRIYLKDAHDHLVEANESLDNFRDQLQSLLDTYLSLSSSKTNSTMRFLTIIATIFIPLTFLVGIYGMNFEVMPELKWKWGYLFIWSLMILSSLGMIVFFKKKKWL